MTTPHNNAAPGAIAKTVLMPGDPLRAQYIANTFLEDAVLVNSLRGINGYTGKYKDKPVTVMASGMGLPSIGIYSYELFNFYDVDNIIRVGSAGSYVSELDLRDVLLASGAFSHSTYAKMQCGNTADTMYPSEELNEKIRTAARRLKIPFKEGLVYSSDVFYYEDAVSYYHDIVTVHGCKAVEMESFALFSNAKAAGKNASSLLTISDSLVTKQETTPEERVSTFTNMMRIALETILL